ncbi:MAG: quinate 5-dehydrogenase [Ardenticatenaceae bacterium]|nr:quinate 5-dehydrogenase [Ardenticatenaceae bacterium]MCB8991803.1 quinate 5-dehydrogenase [Ardenticatenaceae bacterium]
MKRAVSVSLGSSERDKAVEITLLGEQVSIERQGTDGDIEKAIARFTELDGQVDALGVGGIDLWVQMGEKRYPIHDAQRLVKNVHKTPVVDGSGLKNTLERQVVKALINELGPQYASGKVLITVGVDRYGMTLAFAEQGYELAMGDMFFALGIPIALHKLSQLHLMAKLLIPIATRLPLKYLYPTGEKQDEIIPKFTNWYEWADVIAGDCHYIRRHMPVNLAGKVIVTNTTTLKDMELFRQRGVKAVLTTTPQLDGRSFGTNMMEAALTAVAAKNRPLSHAELDEMLAQLDMKPTIHML